jgi:WD40 repeat protein
MRRGTLSCLVLGILCTPGWAEGLPVRQIDRRNRMFPELVVESGGRHATCDVLTFTRDGKHLLAVGDDKVVRVWGYRDGRFDSESMKPLRWSLSGPQRGAIYALAVSPDPEGRRVAIGGVGMKTTAAAVIDRLTGDVQTIYPIDHPAAPKKEGFQSVRSITFSPSGECIAFGSADGSVWLWRPKSKGLDELRWLGKHSSGEKQLNRVRFLHFLNEKKLLSVAQNGEVFQWDLAADTAKRQILTILEDVSGPIHDVLLSPDGKWLAARAMNKPTIYVRSFDGRQQKDITLEKNTVASALAFDARGRLAASIRSRLPNDEGFHLHSNDQIRLYDLCAEEARVEQGPPHSWRVDMLAFHPEGKVLAVAGGEKQEVTLWDLSRPQKRPLELCGEGSAIWNVGLTRNGRYLAFQTQRDPELRHPNHRGRGPWKLFDLRLRKWIATPADFTPLPALETQDGWHVKPTKSAYIWYVKNPDLDIKYELPWNSSLQEMPRCYAFLPRPEGHPVRLAVGHYNGVSIFEVTKTHIRLIWQGMGHEGEVMSLAISSDGKWMVSASDDQTICAWDLSDWPCGSELGARFADDGNGRIVVERVDLFGPAWEAGMVDGDIVVGLQTDRKVQYFRPQEDSRKPPVGRVDACLHALAHPEPGKVMIFRIQRGRNEWIDMHTSVRRRPLWRFFPTRNKEDWVLWMGGDPYYDTSNNGDKYIGWHMNNSDDVKKTPRFYKAEQFRKIFHQPAVIEKLLAERDIRQALEESDAGLKPPNFDKLFDAVSVRIESPQKQVKDTDVQVTLHIKPRTDNPDFAPVRAELWVNDHRLMVWPQKGEPFPKTWPKTWTIEREHLRAGDNDVVLQCYNRVQGRGEGRLEASVSLRCEREVRRKPNLYGLVVGINDYSRSATLGPQQPRLRNLNTPLFDMQAIREAWQDQRGGKVYSKVDIVLLPNKEGKADRKTILEELKRLSKKAGPDDQVFVFLAGHGTVLDLKGKKSFVFCCPDFDLHKPLTSISARDLYESLADIPCRKVVFLDVCHSGEVVRPVRDLTPGGRGPTILAACDSVESSWEPLEAEARNRESGTAQPEPDLKSLKEKQPKVLKHSFYVAALLEALQYADKDGDGLIDAHEIFEYTLIRVPQLLNEAKLDETQTPTCFPARLERKVLLEVRRPSQK